MQPSVTVGPVSADTAGEDSAGTIAATRAARAETAVTRRRDFMLHLIERRDGYRINEVE
jgi:hypothetical protein